MKKVTVVYKVKPYISVVYTCDTIESLYDGEAFGLITYGYMSSKTFIPKKIIKVITLDSVDSITIEHEDNR